MRTALAEDLALATLVLGAVNIPAAEALSDHPPAQQHVRQTGTARFARGIRYPRPLGIRPTAW